MAIVDENKPVLKDLRQVDDLKIPDPKKDGRLPEWLETTQRIAEKIGKTHIVMGRGDTGPFSLLTLLRGTEEFMLDMAKTREAIPEFTLLMGNVNPSDPLYLGSPADVEAAVKKVVDDTKGRGLIISSGCAIGANTPPENMKALIDAGRKYGAYEYVAGLRK